MARSLLDPAPAIEQFQEKGETVFRPGIASNKEVALEKQKGRHCADLSYRYDVPRQYIRGRGPKANCLQ
ncbi:hypothetical protein [Mesorhizobium sp. Root695]|uniref:hypothetical protein n=1 Tax=Mesorhizobium sp. Root695 TaxID=1736589 RepID=UPI000A3F0DD8|nr:hypothetical protein [Mesorhizobium sp. Root695]